MEYLFAQTGKVLQDIISDTEIDNEGLARQEAASTTDSGEEDPDNADEDVSLPRHKRHKMRLTKGSTTTFKVRGMNICVPVVDSVKRPSIAVKEELHKGQTLIDTWSYL